ncbi:MULTISPECIES: hypothetical protein [unclassified Nitratiruptor]|uniref:hypothetical protein n=1 Tax=unclassified Nitratiruptor TaxID=2624044 RepID=UPI001915BD46|nr:MULTISPECIES: hypothetical protein [unclassified Nitratiruptor]
MSLRICNINRSNSQMSRVFVDEEGIYYLWILYSGYPDLEIVPFKKENNKFIEIKTPKVDELYDYLRFRFCNETVFEIEKLFESLLWDYSKFTIPKNIVEKFGEKFCEYFLRDRDNEFIFLDPYAKHWIIDFEKVRNQEKEFLQEPELLPFTITELGVTLTKDLELQKDGKNLSIEEFWKVYDEYRLSLIPIAKKKDKIFRKIEEDLGKRVKESLREIKSKKISDYNIEIQVKVFDTLLGYEQFLELFYTEEMFEDGVLYHLRELNNMEVCRLFWHVIEFFGLRIITTELSFWSEITIDNQKFFRL